MAGLVCLSPSRSSRRLLPLALALQTSVRPSVEKEIKPMPRRLGCLSAENVIYYSVLTFVNGGSTSHLDTSEFRKIYDIFSRDANTLIVEYFVKCNVHYVIFYWELEI